MREEANNSLLGSGDFGGISRPYYEQFGEKNQVLVTSQRRMKVSNIGHFEQFSGIFSILCF